MNPATILLLSLFSLPSFAAWDSVMVILRPSKAIVQINDRGGAEKRLSSFLAALSGQNTGDVMLISADESVKLDCGRNNVGAASCVLRFLPSESVQISAKQVNARLTAASLGLPSDRALPNIDVTFLNSNGDKFNLRLNNGLVELAGSKR